MQKMQKALVINPQPGFFSDGERNTLGKLAAWLYVEGLAHGLDRLHTAGLVQERQPGGRIKVTFHPDRARAAAAGLSVERLGFLEDVIIGNGVEEEPKGTVLIGLSTDEAEAAWLEHCIGCAEAWVEQGVRLAPASDPSSEPVLN
jgi:hypothetical protein